MNKLSRRKNANNKKRIKNLDLMIYVIIKISKFIYGHYTSD